MKRKNDIEQDIDQKEFEGELNRNLEDQYQKIETQNKFFEDKNPYAVGAIQFLGTLTATFGVYFILKYLLSRLTMGYLSFIFAYTDPVVFVVSVGLSVVAVIKRKSPVDTFLDRIS